MSARNWFRSQRTNTTTQPARRPGARLGVEQLEDRAVPAVDFVSAVGLGNDAGWSEAYDVAVDSAGNSYLYSAGSLTP